MSNRVQVPLNQKNKISLIFCNGVLNPLVYTQLYSVSRYPRLRQVFQVTSKWKKKMSIFFIINFCKKSVFVPVIFFEWEMIMCQCVNLGNFPFHHRYVNFFLLKIVQTCSLYILGLNIICTLNLYKMAIYKNELYNRMDVFDLN